MGWGEAGAVLMLAAAASRTQFSDILRSQTVPDLQSRGLLPTLQMRTSL